MSQLDEILKKNLGSAFAENAGLVKKVKGNKLKAFYESSSAYKAVSLNIDNEIYKGTINEIISHVNQNKVGSAGEAFKFDAKKVMGKIGDVFTFIINIFKKIVMFLSTLLGGDLNKRLNNTAAKIVTLSGRLKHNWKNSGADLTGNLNLGGRVSSIMNYFTQEDKLGRMDEYVKINAEGVQRLLETITIPDTGSATAGVGIILALGEVHHKEGKPAIKQYIQALEKNLQDVASFTEHNSIDAKQVEKDFNEILTAKGDTNNGVGGNLDIYAVLDNTHKFILSAISSYGKFTYAKNVLDKTVKKFESLVKSHKGHIVDKEDANMLLKTLSTTQNAVLKKASDSIKVVKVIDYSINIVIDTVNKGFDITSKAQRKKVRKADRAEQALDKI